MQQIFFIKILIVILWFTNLMATETICLESMKTKPMIMISINNFGAIPNDNKDDSEAIRKALEVNGHISMKKGVYNVKEITRVDAETIIDGNGSTFVSQLDTSNQGRSSKNILTLQGEGIMIRNLTLDGAYTNGNAKEGTNIASLLHIYDSENIVLEKVNTINHASNWWSSKAFSLFELNSNHEKDMYHVIYIGFSKNIKIRNMEQKRNIHTEGLLIYESDNIKIDNFKSLNSPNIWTSLHVVASDNIELNNIEVADGIKNQGGSSINFIANSEFVVKNTKTTTKQGFDISNEIKIKGLEGRLTRDSSNGIFENCHFEGQRGLYAYPSIVKNENLLFKNTKFIPTKEGSGTWGARIHKGGNIRFEACTFGSKAFKTYGIIMGKSEEVRVVNCKFINPSVGVYFFGEKFGKLKVANNVFEGNDYSPVNFYWKSNGAKATVREFSNLENKTIGMLINNRFFNVEGDIELENTSSK